MTQSETKARSIRSFVRRSGRITPAQKSAIETHWGKYGYDFDEAVIDFSPGFAGVKLEIGIGNGDALVSMAAADPDHLYIGIEVHEPGIGRCLNNIKQQGLENLRLISHDAIEVLQHMIAPGSLRRVMLFFPDPWHKKRHHKRRIVNAEFRDLVDAVLEPGGHFHAATDWQDYAGHIATEFLFDPRFENLGDAEGYVQCPEYRPATHFEQRGIKLGHGVWDLLFVKK